MRGIQSLLSILTMSLLSDLASYVVNTTKIAIKSTATIDPADMPTLETLRQVTKEHNENSAINCVTASTVCAVAVPFFAKYVSSSTTGAVVGSATLLFSSWYLYFMASNLRAVEPREHLYVRFPVMPVLNYTVCGAIEARPISCYPPWHMPRLTWGYD